MEKKHGQYLNPGNDAFRLIANPDYVDKTLLADQLNHRIGTDKCLICISRPRRFGKSYAAKMLTAYYDSSCDSHELFDNKKIAKTKGYAIHLNQYNVICFDVTSFISVARRNKISLLDIPNMIVDALQKELVFFQKFGVREALFGIAELGQRVGKV